MEKTNDTGGDISYLDDIEPQGIEQTTQDVYSSYDLSLESIHTLSSSVDGLTCAIAGTQPTSPILHLAVSAVAAAFAAYIFNLIHWQTTRKKEKLSILVDETEGLIKELGEVSVGYWLKSRENDNSAEFKHIEIRIKSTHQSIVKSNSLLSNEIENTNKNLIRKMLTRKTQNTTKDLLDNLNEFLDEIFDLITGGDFESYPREPDNIRATRISSKCAGIQSTIKNLSFCF